MVNENKVIEILKQCYDPEIPVDLWSLGLIYNINISEAKNNKSDVSITMTLTTPGCTMGSYMAEDIKMKLSGIKGINSSEVDVTFDPPWKPEMMDDDARKKLGFPVNETTNTDKQEKEERNWE
jgi:metal-sulfur cluster biosynthetic enzyme